MSIYYNSLLRRIKVLESIIYESKKDQETLQNFLGPEYYDKFQIVKNKINDPEYKDIYRLVKKDPEEVKIYIDNIQSQSDKRRDDKKGAKLLYEDPEWRVYRITTYPAAQLYGKGTKWCIAGRYPGHEGRGEEYFYGYIDDYNLDGGYYFYLNKKDPSLKYCVLQNRRHEVHSIWDAADTNKGVNKFVISSDGINLPNVDGINLHDAGNIKDDFFNAVYNSNVNALKSILKYGIIDPNEKADNGKTALFIASNGYDDEIVKLLLDAGADPNITVGLANETPLFNAIDSTSNKEIIKLLLDAGADPNIKTVYNNFALMITTCNDNIELVKLLLDAGADPNMKDEDGYTPLMEASTNGYIRIVKLLLNAGANPNIVTDDGDTALSLVCTVEPNKRVVKLLLDAGADPNIRNKYGNTARSFAIKDDNFDIVDLLDKYDAKE